MKLTDDETCFFGAMMFIAGINTERGTGKFGLSRVTADEMRKAKAEVAVELAKFKRLAKGQRKLAPSERKGTLQ